jgi:large subunit ribosomal protein L15
LPIIKRLPEKRGFTNIFKREFHIVNVRSMNVFPPDSDVVPEDMLLAGLIDDLKQPVKVLGGGDLDRPLIVKAHCFSSSAEKKITAAGGRVERL